MPKFSLSDQLRAAIEIVGERHSAIASGASIQPATLSRFMNGQGGLSSESIDRLCRYLDIVIASSREWQKRDRIYEMWRAGTLPPR
jgi:plasmid maintenance system antidote protein VapI